MNQRIKSLILALMVMGGTIAMSAQFRWGPTAGVDFTTLKFKQTLAPVSGSVGEIVGVQGEKMFPGLGFGIDFGFMYSQRGATVDLGTKEIWASDGYGRERSWLHYIEIPLDLRFKWTRMAGFEDYVAPYVFGGPVFSFLAGHNSVKAYEYAGGDVGVQCGFGLEVLKRWQVQGSYNWGMTYALKAVKLMDYSARNRMWQVRVTYLF